MKKFSKSSLVLSFALVANLANPTLARADKDVVGGLKWLGGKIGKGAKAYKDSFKDEKSKDEKSQDEQSTHEQSTDEQSAQEQSKDKQFNDEIDVQETQQPVAPPPPVDGETAMNPDAPPPPPPPGPADGAMSVYDLDYIFQCTTLATSWDGNRLNPKYEIVPGIYADSKTSSVKRCEFKGADGEKWHPLFPSHPQVKDEACRIAYENQKKGNTISKFPTPASCLTTNEVANLMSANVPASASPELGQSISFATRIEMIRRAKKSIRIQYLIFFGDESGWAIAEELKKKKIADPSIDIRINVDALSNIANETNQKYRTQAMFFDLQQYGVKINGAGLGWVYLNEYFAADPMNLDKRWHDKIFVVDAEDPDNGYGIAGGQNIGNEYFRVGTYENGTPVFDHKIWRDQDVLLRGPIIRDLAKAFDNNFEHFTKLAQNNADTLDASKQTGFMNQLFAKAKAGATSLAAKAAGALSSTDLQMIDWDSLRKVMGNADPAHRPLFQSLSTDGWHLIAQVEKDCAKFFRGVACRAVWDKVPGSHDRLRIVFDPYNNAYAGKGAINKENGQPYMNQNIKAHIARIYADLAKGSLIDQLQARKRFHAADMRWFNNHPRFGETYIMQAYTDAVRRSKSEIILSNAYFIPNGNKDYGLDVDFMTELKKAVTQRGVHVILMSNDPEDNDLPLITYNARWYYPEVLAWNTQAKVGPNGKKGLVEFYEWNGITYHENTNHSKYGVFDAKEAIVGSFNLDHRSTSINSETVVALKSPGLASEMADQFKNKDLPKAKLITPEQANAFVAEIKASKDPKINVIANETLRPVIEREN